MDMKAKRLAHDVWALRNNYHYQGILSALRERFSSEVLHVPNGKMKETPAVEPQAQGKNVSGADNNQNNALLPFAMEAPGNKPAGEILELLDPECALKILLQETDSGTRPAITANTAKEDL